MKEGKITMFGSEIDMFIDDTIGDAKEIEIAFGHKPMF